MWLREKALDYVRDVMRSRPPDFVIKHGDHVNVNRWWLISRNPVLNIYAHEILVSDDARALHDHPWWNLSWILMGLYVEVTIAAGGVHYYKTYRAGAFRFRTAKMAHRLELQPGRSAITIFITGPRLREWGFHCQKAWRSYLEYTHRTPGTSTTGRGCGD